MRARTGRVGAEAGLGSGGGFGVRLLLWAVGTLSQVGTPTQPFIRSLENPLNPPKVSFFMTFIPVPAFSV